MFEGDEISQPDVPSLVPEVVASFVEIRRREPRNSEHSHPPRPGRLVITQRCSVRARRRRKEYIE